MSARDGVVLDNVRRAKELQWCRPDQDAAERREEGGEDKRRPIGGGGRMAVRASFLKNERRTPEGVQVEGHDGNDERAVLLFKPLRWWTNLT